MECEIHILNPPDTATRAEAAAILGPINHNTDETLGIMWFLRFFDARKNTFPVHHMYHQMRLCLQGNSVCSV